METESTVGGHSANLDHATTEVRMPWYMWLLAWLSTSLSGGCFGALFMLLQGGGFQAAGAGFTMGFYLATVVGAFVVPTFGLLSRLLRLRGRESLRMMTIAGGATGLLSGLIVWPLCLFTCVFGAVGARLPGKTYLTRAQFAE